MRHINEIIVHCSATKTNQSFSVEDIRSWHKQRGWSDIGYHFYIDLDGVLHDGRPISKIGAHVKGRNRNSIGVCFEGGYLPNGDMWKSPNQEQIKTFAKLRKKLNHHFDSDLKLSAHYEYSSKTCPNFNKELLNI